MDYKKIVSLHEEIELMKAKEKFIKKESVKKRANLIRHSLTGNLTGVEKAVAEIRILESELFELHSMNADRERELKSAMAIK